MKQKFVFPTSLIWSVFFGGRIFLTMAIYSVIKTKTIIIVVISTQRDLKIYN